MSSPERLSEQQRESEARTLPVGEGLRSGPHVLPGTNAPFVVLTTQRNGSTWVMSVLNAHETVIAQGELFLPRPRSPEKRWDSDFAYPRYVESRAELGTVRPFAVFRYLDSFFAQGEHVGFKLMYSQLKAYPEIVLYLRRHRVRVVHLVRENHLDVLISFALKRKIGRAHVLEAKDRPRELTVALPTRSLLRDLRWLQFKHDVARRLLRASGLPHFDVTYEELVRRPGSFGGILEFLGLSTGGGEPLSNILKTRLGGQKDVVANYDEVRQVLTNTRFAALLD